MRAGPWLLLVLLSTSACAQQTTTTHLLYRGIQPGSIPPTTIDQHGQSFKITGMSGITYAGGSIFWAVMDNSDKLVRFDVTFNDDCSIRKCRVAGGITLAERHDYEGVAIADAKGATIYASEEDTPAIHRFDLTTGRKLDDICIPEVFSHIMRNQGLESVTLTADRMTLWTANERALLIDGNLKAPAEPFGATTRVRLQCFRASKAQGLQSLGFSAASQYVYRTSSVHDLGGQIGLCDLVALPDGRLLALERSAAEALGGWRSIRNRIFLVDFTDATDVSGPEFADGLKDKPVTPVRKKLLYDGFIFDDNGENLEGLCLGPQVAKNRYLVLGVVDDGDSIGVSKPRIVAFELLLPAPP